MAFSPFARFRNFTVENLKALLKVYPDEARTMTWNEAVNEIESVSPGYKRTSYQQACQFGLEDRGGERFRIQTYLFTFDDENLKRYIEFWIKIYFAPNPYVKSNDEPFLIYCEIVKEILNAPNHEIKYYDFFNDRIGGGSGDILLNAIKNYAHPVKGKKAGGEDILFIGDGDIAEAQREVDYIEQNLPIGDPSDRGEFFNRHSYENFCNFFGISLELPEEKAGTGTWDSSDGRRTGAGNILFYGVPGAGKSHVIKTKYCSDEKYMERVVFHPDYTYSDFTGQILPKIEETEEGEKLTYVFTPGPFTRILKRAEKDPGNFYYLVIEELNRGNAPAIFGEIFQLLDRKGEEDPAGKIGESEYGISNPDVARVVYGDEGHEVRIPSNMYVLATMNTADQNVFTLDTAFQRRWDMEPVKNEFGSSKHAQDLIMETAISWGAFATVINNLVIEINADLASSEDKRLGIYFAKKRELSVERFPKKVLKYLWDDAFKMDREAVFRSDCKSLEDVISAYEKAEGDKLEAILQEEVYKKMLAEMQKQAVTIDAEN